MKKIFTILASANSSISLTTTALLVLILPYISLAQIKIEERVEIDPVIISIPNNPGFNIDTTVCNKFEYESEILVTDGDDSTYSVWYGNCAEIGFGGHYDCIHFDLNDDGWIVTIEEGFEYVRPRTSYLYCDGPYGDEGNTFYVDYNYCFHLVFDKQEPENMAQVKIKFANNTKVAHYTFDVYKPFFHITPEDSFQVMEYGDYIVVDNYEVLNQCDTYWPWLPDTVSIIKEIVQGNEYGQLWNSFTNEYGTSFTGSDIYLVANGIKPPQDAEIIVRLSTSDSDIDPINIVYIVRPVDLEITVVPPTIAAGDTASIIIQKKYLDGTVSDFDEWQTFEIAKIEGCELGEILVDGETGAYFSDVYQPIQFVADSLAESGTVKLKIGVLKYPSFATRPVVINNTPPVQTEQSQIITNDNNSESTITENQTNPPSDNPLLSCALEPVESVLNEDIGVVVGDECDEWACDQNFDKYNGTIGIKDEAANYNSYNLCRYWNIVEGVGGFFPLFDKEKWYLGNGQLTEIKDKLIIPYQLDACYNTNTNENYWQFSIPENSISLRAIIDVCESNIGYEHIIHNLQELSIIPNENTCLALEDFEKQREYGPIASMYYIYEMAWEHEKVHKNDFYNRIKELLNYKFEYNNETFTYKEWLTTAFQPECSELVNTKSKAIYQAKKHHDEILKEFIIKLENEWNEFTHDGDDILHRKYEKNTQANPMVQWKIRQYKFELQKRPSEYWENCEFKEETE